MFPVSVNQRGRGMSIGSLKLHHVNVTVSRSLEDETKHFYGSILGLTEIPKPESSRGRGGAWYVMGSVHLHLSREEIQETRSKRHMCLTVADLENARLSLRDSGVEILPDDQPIPGVNRFYIRDPGGNLLEIAAE